MCGTRTDGGGDAGEENSGVYRRRVRYSSGHYHNRKRHRYSQRQYDDHQSGATLWSERPPSAQRRVGRSNVKAYCYLLIPPIASITDDARRRIRAIEAFSDLGSGFNIAMQDLDIRGAGNLLVRKRAVHCRDGIRYLYADSQ